MNLTNASCNNAKPKTKTYRLTDGDGLYLEIAPNGSRYWRFKYRYNNKSKVLAFGTYPEVALSEARDKRHIARKQVREGIDPSEVRKKEKQLAKFKGEQTFENVAREWHLKNMPEWSKSHSETILYRLELDIFPRIGSLPIHSITPPILYTSIDAIQERGANDLAKRVLQNCSQIFRYAVSTGRMERDFTADLKGTFKKGKRGHFASIEVDELPDLIDALNKNETRLFKQTILAIKLLMLTFVRTGELRNATWAEIDFDKALWVIPACRMKMRLDHIVPLSNQSLAILKELKDKSGKREFVFPSIAKPKKSMSDNTILKALQRMGYHKRMTGHGFRSLAMSAIKEKLHYRHEVIDRQLAHVPKKSVDRAYDRAKFLDERKVMMQQWADYIDKISKKDEQSNLHTKMPIKTLSFSFGQQQLVAPLNTSVFFGKPNTIIH